MTSSIREDGGDGIFQSTLDTAAFNAVPDSIEYMGRQDSLDKDRTDPLQEVENSVLGIETRQ